MKIIYFRHIKFLDRNKSRPIVYISKLSCFWERCNFEGEDAKPHRSFVNHEEVTLFNLGTFKVTFSLRESFNHRTFKDLK